MEHAEVLPPSQAKAALKQCSRPTPEHVDGTWVIPPDVAMQLEQDLGKLTGLKPTSCCILEASVRDPDTYYRQYVGITIQGRKYIYINAFRASIADVRRSLRDPSKQKPVIACDGGEGFWGALYDPETRQFSELAFNGVA
jgi:hypothetical protein